MDVPDRRGEAKNKAVDIRPENFIMRKIIQVPVLRVVSMTFNLTIVYFITPNPDKIT